MSSSGEENNVIPTPPRSDITVANADKEDVKEEDEERDEADYELKEPSDDEYFLHRNQYSLYISTTSCVDPRSS
jgi:hypothetical protein